MYRFVERIYIFVIASEEKNFLTLRWRPGFSSVYNYDSEIFITVRLKRQSKIYNETNLERNVPGIPTSMMKKILFRKMTKGYDRSRTSFLQISMAIVSDEMKPKNIL